MMFTIIIAVLDSTKSPFYYFKNFSVFTDNRLRRYTVAFPDQFYESAAATIKVTYKSHCTVECSIVRAAGFNIKLNVDGTFQCQILQTVTDLTLSSDIEWDVYLAPGSEVSD